jgi:hypothetical protein
MISIKVLFVLIITISLFLNVYQKCLGGQVSICLNQTSVTLEQFVDSLEFLIYILEKL